MGRSKNMAHRVFQVILLIDDNYFFLCCLIRECYQQPPLEAVLGFSRSAGGLIIGGEIARGSMQRTFPAP